MVADIAKRSVSREAYYTRELATDHETYRRTRPVIPSVIPPGLLHPTAALVAWQLP